MGIGTAAPRARLDVLDTAQFEDLKITGVGSFMSNLTVGAGLTVTGGTLLSLMMFISVEDLKAVTGDLTISHDSTTYSTITTVDIETLDAKDRQHHWSERSNRYRWYCCYHHDD